MDDILSFYSKEKKINNYKYINNLDENIPFEYEEYFIENGIYSNSIEWIYKDDNDVYKHKKEWGDFKIVDMNPKFIRVTSSYIPIDFLIKHYDEILKWLSIISKAHENIKFEDYDYIIDEIDDIKGPEFIFLITEKETSNMEKILLFINLINKINIKTLHILNLYSFKLIDLLFLINNQNNDNIKNYNNNVKNIICSISLTKEDKYNFMNFFKKIKNQKNNIKTLNIINDDGDIFLHIF